MGTKYASPRWARGICDICGRGDLLLKELKKEVYNQRFTGFLVCPDCWDEDNPQLQLGRYPIIDPQALLNPRPDINVVVSRILWGFSPVGNPSTVCQAKSGRVSVNGQLSTWVGD